MTTPKIVNVYYSGNLKHKGTEQQARQIRATQGEIIKESFRNGGKPLRYFLKEFEKKDRQNNFRKLRWCWKGYARFSTDFM